MSRLEETNRSTHNQRQRQYYDHEPKANMLPTGSPYLRRQMQQVIQTAGIKQGQRILEVGCGMGRYTLLLAEKGFQVIGMDLSPVLLSWLHQHNRKGFLVPTFSADLLELPISSKALFDVVFGGFILHHLHDIPACLESLLRVIRPGGLVVFLEPNPYNPLYYIQIAVKPSMTWAGDKGILKMRRSVLFPALRNAGFENPHLKRFGFLPPFLTNQTLGGSIERRLEAFPFWRKLLPFQILTASRPNND